MKNMPNTTVQAGRADRAPWPGAQTIRPVRHVSALPANPSTGTRDQRGLLSRKPAVMTEFGCCDAE
jgi:hypothetical protein